MSRRQRHLKRPRNRLLLIASLAACVAAGFAAGVAWVAIDMVLRDTLNLPARGERNATPSRSGS